MLSDEALNQRFQLVFERQNYRRIIGTKEVVIHCHHYNARLQNIIEGTKQIDGKSIILESAEEVYGDYIQDFIQPTDTLEQKWQIAAQLYAHLGYGVLDFSQIEQGIVTSNSSHYVEGWQAGFQEVNRPVCTFTEGYLQGVIYGITGQLVYVKEQECMKAGAKQCRFTVDCDRSQALKSYPVNPVNFEPQPNTPNYSHQIDEAKIIDGLIQIPFVGNSQGLIPLFNVYLANTPVDLYTLICLRFLEAMKAKNLYSTAQKLLIFAGEVCAVNTLRGIVISKEWYDLILPMIKEEQDYLYGLVAVTNGLGWGNWHVRHYEMAESLTLEAFNGYEALGYLKYRGLAQESQCLMLTGVAAGMMELLHSDGTVEERMGTYYSQEKQCICCHHQTCLFEVEVL